MSYSPTKPWSSTQVTVKRHTGVSVDSEDIQIAASIIEQYAGLVGGDLSRWPQRQLAWLSRAVDWQAAFVHNNPSLFTTKDASVQAGTVGPRGVRQIRADDVSITYDGGEHSEASVTTREQYDIDIHALTCLRNLAGKTKIRAVKSMKGATGITVTSMKQVDPDEDPPDNRIWRRLAI